MHNPTQKHHRKDPISRRHISWCCSFSDPTRSPENPKPISKQPISSYPNSPKPPSLRNRILSPGRVSPVDPVGQQPKTHVMPVELEMPRLPLEPVSVCKGGEDGFGVFDVRLSLKGRNGGSVVLELSSEVLSGSSCVFADLIAKYRAGCEGGGGSFCRIEVPEVENLSVFQMTIELMFEEDLIKRLMKIGVYRAIDVLEVSAGISFKKGITSCLEYLEAVPWSEDEEEKLKTLFSKFKLNNSISKDILARLYPLDSADSQQTLANQLIWSITTCIDANSRNELKSLVKGLLCKSSVYEKGYPDVNKEEVYAVCRSCIDALVNLFEDASGSDQCGRSGKNEGGKTLIECISMQVDNINWLLEILLDWQMAEDFVTIWVNQGELLCMHERTSPMVRYELSRVSAMLFIVMGTRKLQCASEARLGLLDAWFGPMLLDFGWLQRCKKGLDIKVLEEAMGHLLLTLPLKHQYTLFMEWFRCFSRHGTECPNLSKSFQIWWRRSFLRGSESNAVESR
ncbi:BTB/POZ domain-containing protein At2g13690 [Apium graveolens]|uniref:BTB/POZ domain-containing protein At2g13690 n=1 Tax=Apium graveolens TaxID=4045 RepID=UPI003D7A0DD4